MMGDEVELEVSVVLPASGTGERFGSSIPKQFETISGKPLLLYSIQSFHRIPWVKNIIVTVSKKYLNYVEGLVGKHQLTKVTITLGAPVRHRSIHNGLKTLQSMIKADDVVVVQDANRLFAEEELVKNVAMAAKKFGASGAVRPLVSTVVQTDDNNFLEKSLDRNLYRASEMPQGFIYSTIITAYEQATDMDLDYGTECLHLALKYTGTRAKLIDGNENLWKVTYRKDLYAAEGTLKESEIVAKVFMDEDFDSVKTNIQGKLKERNIMVVEPIRHEKQLINSIVYIDSNIDLNQIKMRTDLYHNTGLIDTVVVHVFLCCGDISEEYKALTSIMQPNKQTVLIYFVLCKNDSDPEKIGAMVSSLIWNRDRVMSGQIFTL